MSWLGGGGAITEVVSAVLPLETALCFAWDLSRFNFNKPVLDNNVDPTIQWRLDVSAVDDAIGSVFLALHVYGLLAVSGYQPCHVLDYGLPVPKE